MFPRRVAKSLLSPWFYPGSLSRNVWSPLTTFHGMFACGASSDLCQHDLGILLWPQGYRGSDGDFLSPDLKLPMSFMTVTTITTKRVTLRSEGSAVGLWTMARPRVGRWCLVQLTGLCRRQLTLPLDLIARGGSRSGTTVGFC